jgi:hypothetical protein
MAQVRTKSMAVVPHRDVVHDAGPMLRSRLVAPTVNPLSLQRAEEAFINTVAPTVAVLPHAVQNAVDLLKPPDLHDWNIGRRGGRTISPFPALRFQIAICTAS